MMSIIMVFLVNLLIESSVSFSVMAPGEPIVGQIGSSVTLPCWISPAENAEALEIRWYRHNQFNNPVLFYNHGEIQEVQEESYRNRSSLTLRLDQSGGLKDGDVSLRLERLRVQDDGPFNCYVSGESAYDSEKVFLQITAVGSTPVLFPEPLDDGRVNISCRSSGWYPQPNVTWTSADGRTLRPGGSSQSRGADGMFSVHSWTAVSASDAQLISCSLSVRAGEIQESRIDVQAVITSDSSGPWKALFFIVFICALLGIVGLILYKYRHKLTGKETVPDCEDGTMDKLINKVVEDMTIEELMQYAVEITIDRERSNQGLTVSNNCKIVRDRTGYDHTGDGYPYELCAFGAQRFTSGRHYWEIDLVRFPNPPKDFWLIGVVKDGVQECSKDRSALTPSAGYWFLCSDGPRGAHTNTDHSITFSLTPRPERLGVLLDYDDGQLSFYNVTDGKHLLTISSRFTGPVVPLFNPGAGDESPMTILDCPKPAETAEESSRLLVSNNSSDA